MFDIKEFQSVTNEQVLDDKFNLHPEGEYEFQIPMDPDKAFTSTSGEKDGKPWAQLQLRLETLDPLGNIEKTLGRKPGITDRFFIDLDPATGSFDHNKQRNIRTGQYLAATGCAKPGWKFSDMLGKRLKGKVVHVKSDMDPSVKVAKVTTLGRAA